MLQVRCLGTAGGCVGILVGAFLGLIVGAGSGNFLVAIMAIALGAFFGGWAGMYLSLHLMSK